jgi:nitrogen-specific signal transduction histidine kinase
VPVLDASGQPLRLIGTAEDITELRRAQTQADTAGRMEAIGRLAGGMAHDFNNILTAILGEADFLNTQLDPEDPRRASVSEICSSSLRAADLTRQLLAFSRQRMFRTQPLDINEIVTSVDKMLRRVIGEDIELRMELEQPLAAVLGDSSQIQQIVLNLVVNSRDAMPDGGRIVVRTAHVEVAGDRRVAAHSLRPGRYVMLSVTDTGAGISDEVKTRMFEPFFTTKERGKGTGLGLATVYGIVEQSSGSIQVESAEGEGTTISVYLPAVAASVEASPASAPAPVRPAAGSRVLVIEDDEHVRAIVVRILKKHGYTVAQASSGEQAIAMSGLPVDLVLSDIVMPGISGPETVTRLRAASPGLKARYMSGYTDRAAVQHQRLHGRDSFLQKPFTPGALLEATQRAISVA